MVGGTPPSIGKRLIYFRFFLLKASLSNNCNSSHWLGSRQVGSFLWSNVFRSYILFPFLCQKLLGTNKLVVLNLTRLKSFKLNTPDLSLDIFCLEWKICALNQWGFHKISSTFSTEVSLCNRDMPIKIIALLQLLQFMQFTWVGQLASLLAVWLRYVPHVFSHKILQVGRLINKFVSKIEMRIYCR